MGQLDERVALITGAAITPEALAVIQEMVPYAPHFIENPLLTDDLEGYPFLHDHSPVPIATGEMQNTRFEFAEIMDKGKVDVIQPDVRRVGGLTEARRVWDMAADRGRLVIPDCWKTAIGIMASVQLRGSRTFTSAVLHSLCVYEPRT